MIRKSREYAPQTSTAGTISREIKTAFGGGSTALRRGTQRIGPPCPGLPACFRSPAPRYPAKRPLHCGNPRTTASGGGKARITLRYAE
ncbi:hypothetical protein [Paenibacillus dendritiformis]|uniref:hypothetical protein n=1 Tax=Paenibacillus dendritiformis TaxID=130049 RepID=UPI001A7F0A20|nr:hypothetical protein [Paenibacillus dendritiformis]